MRSQNPDIKRLGEVLANAEGRDLLETTKNLDAAHASTESVDRRFIGALLRAREAVADAVGSLRAYDGRDASLLEVAEDVKDAAGTVHLSMENMSRDAHGSPGSGNAPSDLQSRNGG